MTRHLTIPALAAALLAGCAAEPPSPLAADHPASADAKQAPQLEHQSIAIADPLAKTATQTSAKVVPYPLDYCIVGEDKLGTMGKPVSFVYEGREIKLCCKGCEPDFRKDPQKFLKKIDDAAKKQPAAPAKHTDHDHKH